jgi:DNA-binding transcriptional MerR regulator
MEINKETGEMVARNMIRSSKKLDEIAVALASAQAEFPILPKTKKVKVQTHDGKSYSYSYADLALIIETILPITSKHGLSIVQMPSLISGQSTLLTRLLHTSGQWIECELPLKAQREGAQAYGSALTYMRRYGMSAILCLATDEDEDGQIADTDHVGVKPQAKKGIALPQQMTEEQRKKFLDTTLTDAKKIASFQEEGLTTDSVKAIEKFWLDNSAKIAELKKTDQEKYDNLVKEFKNIKEKLTQDSVEEGEQNG